MPRFLRSGKNIGRLTQRRQEFPQSLLTLTSGFCYLQLVRPRGNRQDLLHVNSAADSHVVFRVRSRDNLVKVNQVISPYFRVRVSHTAQQLAPSHEGRLSLRFRQLGGVSQHEVQWRQSQPPGLSLSSLTTPVSLSEANAYDSRI